MGKIRSLFIILLISVFTSSCVVEDYFISQLDYFITNRTNKRLGLNSFNKKQLRRDIQDFLKKHQKEIKGLRDTINQIDVNKVDVKEVFIQLNKNYYSMAIDYSEILSKYMLRMNEVQKRRFFESEDKKNKEILKQIENSETKKYHRPYEFLLGDLTKDQKSILSNMKPLFTEQAKLRWERRVKIQTKMKEIFAWTDKEKMKQHLIQEFITYNEHHKDLSKNQGRLKILDKIQLISSSLSNDQKEHAKDKLMTLSRWLEKFSKAEY